MLKRIPLTMQVSAQPCNREGGSLPTAAWRRRQGDPPVTRPRRKRLRPRSCCWSPPAVSSCWPGSFLPAPPESRHRPLLSPLQNPHCCRKGDTRSQWGADSLINTGCPLDCPQRSECLRCDSSFSCLTEPRTHLRDCAFSHCNHSLYIKSANTDTVWQQTNWY